LTLVAVKLQNVTKIFQDLRSDKRVIAVDQMNLEIYQGEFFTFLGPSGCGKTTTLRLIAGFEQPTSGEIFIEGKPVSNIPPNQRPVNTVFQNYALFPHLNVENNVAFGLKLKRVPSVERQRKVREALEMVRLPGMEKRRPPQLSGGQQQRVALARALINEPAVLLLDEPLGALDLKLRKAVQLELKQLQHQLGITFIYVTHDQEEALTISDRIAVMNDGVIQQIGMPRKIYEQPINRFVADFIGETNFIKATVRKISDFVYLDAGGLQMLGTAGDGSIMPGQEVTLTIRPEKMNLYPPGKQDVLETETGMNAADFARLFGTQKITAEVDTKKYLEAEANSVVLTGQVREAIYIGTDIRYMVKLPNETALVVRVQNFGQRYDTTFDVGDNVLVHWPAENARVLVD